MVLDECLMIWLVGILNVLPHEEFCVRKTIQRIFILKAFTKIYSMAGLRLGYAFSSNQNLLLKMKEVMQPWNVFSLLPSMQVYCT